MTQHNEAGFTPLVGKNLPRLEGGHLNAIASVLMVTKEAWNNENLVGELAGVFRTNSGIQHLYQMVQTKTEMKMAHLEPLLPVFDAVLKYLNAGAAQGATFVGFAQTLLSLVKVAEKK